MPLLAMEFRIAVLATSVLQLAVLATSVLATLVLATVVMATLVLAALVVEAPMDAMEATWVVEARQVVECLVKQLVHILAAELGRQ